jgi:hypothetical protein
MSKHPSAHHRLDMMDVLEKDLGGMVMTMYI